MKGLLFKTVKQNFVLTFVFTFFNMGNLLRKGGLDVSEKRIRINELDDFHSAHLKLMNKLFELI